MPAQSARAASSSTPPATRARRSESLKALETLAGARCPCGHLAQRHRKAAGVPLAGVRANWGACRDCGCRGLVELEEVEEP